MPGKLVMLSRYMPFKVSRACRTGPVGLNHGGSGDLQAVQKLKACKRQAAGLSNTAWKLLSWSTVFQESSKGENGGAREVERLAT